MKNRTALVLLAAALFSFTAAVRADDAVSLQRQWKIGDRTAITSSVILRITDTETPFGGSISTPGITDEESRSETHVLDARDGKFQILQVMVDKDDVENQPPGAPHGQNSRGALAGKKLMLNRHVDPDFHEEKIDVAAEGSVLDPDVEESVRDMFAVSYVPDQAVPVGGRWKTDKVEALFGAHTHGHINFLFRGIDQTPDGKRIAVIEPSGEVTLDLGARLVAGGPAAGAMSDLTVIYKVGGSIHIDLATGIPVAVDLNGEARVEHGVSSGAPTVQHGTYSFVTKVLPLEPVMPGQDTGPRITSTGNIPPTTAGRGSMPNPALAVFAGDYKADQIHLDLKADGDGLSGTIEVKGQSYPIRAHLAAGGIAGAFQSNGSTFSFTASLDGDTLNLVTDNRTFALKKQAAENPLHQLSATQPANPLTH